MKLPTLVYPSYWRDMAIQVPFSLNLPTPYERFFIDHVDYNGGGLVPKLLQLTRSSK